MNTHSIRLITIPIFLAFVSLLSGCAAVGMMASKSRSFSMESSFSLEGVTRDPISLAQQAGQILEMNVLTIDRRSGTLILDASSSMAMVALIGKGTHQQIGVQHNAQTNALDISVTVQGNFGTGTEDAAQELLNKFLTKLEEIKD